MRARSIILLSSDLSILFFSTGKPAELFDNENPDWAPTQHLGHDFLVKASSSDEKTIAEKNKARYERHRERNIKRQILEELNETKEAESGGIDDSFLVVADAALDCNTPNDKTESNRYTTPSNWQNEMGTQALSGNEGTTMTSSVGCQTETTSEYISQLEKELQLRTAEIHDLKQKILEGSLNEEGFKDNDEKVRFYTGLPNFMVLMTLFNFLEGCVTTTARTSLSKFQQFIMTLMRLRLNLTLTDLGYRYHVHESTVSRVFTLWINLMHTRLSPLIRWPEREQLWKTTPLSFRKHFSTKVAIIIDCFEIFCDKPTNLLARSATFSTYKHHNTVKYLIGISPQGVISFISEGWGGRCSDKFITENCGILKNLLPGDVVLADRGFDIQDSVACYYAEIKIPDFTKGKKQLAPLEVENNQKIASVRIHVERVIGNVRRKYSMLQSTLPIDYLITEDGDKTIAMIDKIVTVCCALTNMCDSVVPFS